MAVRIRKKPAFDIDIDMTPMIDVVFNLIIFFMVITDMTQTELELLILPKADLAVEDKGEDTERLVINIVDPEAPANKGRLDPKGLPIFFKSQQMADWAMLRDHLRKWADPTLYPEKFHPETEQPMSPVGKLNGRAVYPSRKSLLVRCDQGQIFGWVQAIMQVCTIMPGHKMPQELRESPFIYKLEIAVAEEAPEEGK